MLVRLPAFSFLVIVLSGVLTPISGQTQPDPRGWGKLTWGMPNDQALAAYAGTIKQSPRGTRHGITDRFTIGEIYAEDLELEAAVATPDDSDQVIRVALTPAREPHDPRYVHSTRYYYERLLTLLVEKYGAPTFTDRSGDEKLHIWAFPSTSIVLTFRTEGVAVRYSAVNATAHEAI